MQSIPYIKEKYQILYKYSFFNKDNNFALLAIHYCRKAKYTMMPYHFLGSNEDHKILPILETPDIE